MDLLLSVTGFVVCWFMLLLWLLFLSSLLVICCVLRACAFTQSVWACQHDWHLCCALLLSYCFYYLCFAIGQFVNSAVAVSGTMENLCLLIFKFILGWNMLRIASHFWKLMLKWKFWKVLTLCKLQNLESRKSRNIRTSCLLRSIYRHNKVLHNQNNNYHYQCWSSCAA